MKKMSIFLVAMLTTMSLLAQSWVEGMQDHTVNFYDVQAAFNEYAEGYNKGFFNTKSGNPPGFSQYKRWEAFWEPRVAPSGIRPNPGNSLARSSWHIAKQQIRRCNYDHRTNWQLDTKRTL